MFDISRDRRVTFWTRSLTCVKPISDEAQNWSHHNVMYGLAFMSD